MRIELGIHFNWRFGSYICEINRSALSDPNLIKLFKKGELIEVICTEFDDSDNPIFGPLYEPEPDDNIMLKRLIGKEVDVEVIIDTPEHIEYLVEKNIQVFCRSHLCYILKKQLRSKVDIKTRKWT